MLQVNHMLTGRNNTSFLKHIPSFDVLKMAVKGSESGDPNFLRAQLCRFVCCECCTSLACGVLAFVVFHDLFTHICSCSFASLVMLICNENGHSGNY